MGDELGAAQALAQLGNLLSAEGEHELARELHEESLAVREAANDARGIGLSLLAISVAAAHGAEPERAFATAQRALELFDRTDDGPGRAAAVMQMGYLTADAGRQRDARDLQERALALWKAFAPTPAGARRSSSSWRSSTPRSARPSGCRDGSGRRSRSSRT